jgi:hypothetical protein
MNRDNVVDIGVEFPDKTAAGIEPSRSYGD